MTAAAAAAQLKSFARWRTSGAVGKAGALDARDMQQASREAICYVHACQAAAMGAAFCKSQ